MARWSAVLAASALALTPSRPPACCAVGAGGASVHFSGQTNLVVWDAEHGVEHFVRDARFETTGESLGFIAPTPGKPSLGEVDRAVFTDLARLEPQDPTPMELKVMPTASAAEPRAVTVIETSDVAGYRATVLRATDANALTTWLRENDYPSAPWVTNWTKPYVAKGWFLTAFKVLATDGQTATGAVRMSFKTDRPFNPYSVPAENTGRSPLRLFYVSAGSEEPRIGGTRTWIAPKWRASLPGSMRWTLAYQLGVSELEVPENATVSTYIDDDFSRPGTDDLFFVSAVPAWIEIVLTAFGLGGAAYLLGRRRPASSFPVTRAAE